ncbi:MAG: beta-propeller fold lactonase family protein [Terriglobales bacterium]
MSFLRAARAALADQSCFPRILVAVVVVLAGLSLSCSSYSGTTVPDHNAYVTLPATGNVLLLHINGSTGVITTGAQTPQVEGTSPNGLALLPSKKFLYAINSRANTISIFNVASDGTLTLNGTPAPAGSGPDAAVIDPTGKYLLATNNFSNDVSVFSIDPASGALSEVPGSPFFANADPTEILITPSGKSVYVTNPLIGMVTAFSFSNGVLTQVPGSPVFSGAGAYGLAVDGSGRFLYVANPSASNSSVPTIGNISGFNIDPVTGALSPILGSPFTSTTGTGPTALTIDPSGRFVYAVTPGSSFSIWCFAITPTNGQLVAITSSPFSLAAGGLFALIDPSGNHFYIGSPTANGVEGYTYNPSTGAPTVIAGSPFSTGTAPGKMVISE